MTFQDRRDAGRHLADRLAHLAGEDVLVLALPRGGVPVAFEVARRLCAPLDVWVARKLGVPYQPELGMGAIAEGGGMFLNATVLRAAEVRPEEIDTAIAREEREVERRKARYRRGRPPPTVAGRAVIVVDDGIATGGTVRAAVAALKQQGAARVVLAVPVAPDDTAADFEGLVDEVVCVERPASLWSIGGFYDDFAQVSDEEVVALLARAPPPAPAASVPPR